jgi:hypothetical protein
VVADSIVSGSVAAGIANMTAHPGAVQLRGTVVVFDNNPDYVGLDPRGYE